MHDPTLVSPLVQAIYGYSQEDITVLVDRPEYPDHLQPTYDNIVSGTVAFL